MLSKFIYNDCYKKVPFTGNIYEMHPKGSIRDTVNKTELVPYVEDGVHKVMSSTDEWFDGIDLARLLAIVFRNPTQSIKTLLKMELLFKDNDPSNYSLYNTIWKCPVGKLGHPLYPGFCYIPGYSRYLINLKGELLSPTSGKLLEHYSDANGYLMYGVQPDVGQRTVVGMHRLLALAWMDYPTNVNSLDINHKDTDTSNNDPDNLEWVTRSRNNFHAHENGLSNSISLKVRDISTGDISEYYSASFAATHLGCNGETILNRIKGGVDGKVYDGMQYKLSSDNTPWVIFDNVDEYNHSISIKDIVVEHIPTGVIKTFKGYQKAGQHTGINPGTLRYRLVRNSRITANEFMITLNA